MIREHPPPEKGDAVPGAVDAALARMNVETEREEKAFDLAAHFAEPLRALGEEQEIIHVSDVNRGPKLALDEMVERVEVNVGEELRGLVARGMPRRRSKGVKRLSPGK